MFVQGGANVKAGTSDASRDDNPKPSKVLHIRNIHSDTMEMEIDLLGAPFGRVTNVIMVMKDKNQALLKMEDESSAVAMVSHFAKYMIRLKGMYVRVQYSI